MRARSAAFHGLIRGSPPTHPVRRARLARDLLHDGDGTLANERDGHRVGADAVAGDAAGGEGGAEEGRVRDDTLSAPEVLALQRIRRRRYLMLGLFLGFAPAALLIWSVTGSDGAALLISCVWGVAYLLSVFAVTYSRCPRCGEFFHQGPSHGPTQGAF
jgi:hypothetical protein